MLKQGALPTTAEEVTAFRKKCHILISTPLRLSELANSIDLGLTSVTTLVTDEADNLFDLGFPEVYALLEKML